jgi:hypothetical protein
MSDELGIPGFDVREYDTDTQRGKFQPIPRGTYQLEVKEAEVKENSKKTGRILSAKINVLAPADLVGKWFSTTINLTNSNSTAEKIGREDLAKLSRAIGIPTPTRASELLFKRFTADVDIELPAEGSKYGPKNIITTYYYPDKGDIPAPKVGQADAATAPAQTPTPANTNAPAATEPAKLPANRPWG